MMRCWWLVLLVLLAPLAQAASVHAFLDRNHVSLGDTVTLNIQSDGPLGTPDLAPLQQDFQVLGTSSSSNVQIGNGRTVRTQQLGIALKPLHAGTLTIPSLDVGGVRTSPLTLQVGAAASGGSGKTGDPVFMQTSVLSSSPYVGQQTVYTVRVFYLPGVNGSLSEPTADGARLVKLDRDHSYMVDRDGYAYRVREYAWALIPQRAGAITIQGPTFQGQQLTAGNPGAWLNNPNALTLAARARCAVDVEWAALRRQGEGGRAGDRDAQHQRQRPARRCAAGTGVARDRGCTRVSRPDPGQHRRQRPVVARYAHAQLRDRAAARRPACVACHHLELVGCGSRPRGASQCAGQQFAGQRCRAGPCQCGPATGLERVAGSAIGARGEHCCGGTRAGAWRQPANVLAQRGVAECRPVAAGDRRGRRVVVGAAESACPPR
jgi:hypothetical protein